MVSIIRLHYPNHECDDDLIMLDIPVAADANDTIMKANEILSRPMTEEEEEGCDFLDVLDERLEEIGQKTGCIARTMYSDMVIDAGF